MSSLTIFANFFIDTQERYLRMMDSFKSFYKIRPDKWVINIRGKFKNEAGQFLKNNVKENLILTFRCSEKGWFHDTEQMLGDITSDYVFLWMEDQINIAPIIYFNEVMEDIVKASIDMMWCYTFFNIDNRFDNIKMLDERSIDYFLFDLDSYAIIQKNYPGAYIINYATIMKSSLFKKIILTPMQKLKWPKETPFDFEKDHEHTEWLPLKVAKLKKEMFAPIDDDRKPNYSLQSRGLYPKREGRSSYAIVNKYRNFKEKIINTLKKFLKYCLK